MTIQLKPAQQRLIEREIRSGQFRDAADVLDHALAALLKEESQVPPSDLTKRTSRRSRAQRRVPGPTSTSTVCKTSAPARSVNRFLPFFAKANIRPLTSRIGERRADLSAQAQKRGVHIPIIDGLIATTILNSWEF